ncbi:hypothetical protein EVAR_83741_1 [Eumeta japonica]|uniref:Uncharacterized protein n=1 Tax=Eumeta variegata TaxID=151549 RepID=A0A4C1W9H6_EUMVA|nr:hypothetical protein EVAR_83741_1 [Eumeta japonica]
MLGPLGFTRFCAYADTATIEIGRLNKRTWGCNYRGARITTLQLTHTVLFRRSLFRAFTLERMDRTMSDKTRMSSPKLFYHCAEGSGGVPAGAGGVFGVPLSQCVESERALRRRRLTGSRASLASLAADRADDVNTHFFFFL